MQTVKGLILAGGLALFTLRQSSVWATSVAVWTNASQFGTVRGHVNARQAYLDQGDVFAAIHECVWLLDHLGKAAPWQTHYITGMCKVNR